MLFHLPQMGAVNVSHPVDAAYRDMGSGWASETATLTETTTPQIDRISIPLHELSAMQGPDRPADLGESQVEDIKRDADGDRRIDPAHVVKDYERTADDHGDRSQRVRQVVQEKGTDVHAALAYTKLSEVLSRPLAISALESPNAPVAKKPMAMAAFSSRTVQSVRR